MASFSLTDPPKTVSLVKLSRKTRKMEGCVFHFSCQTCGTNFAAVSFARQTKKP